MQPGYIGVYLSELSSRRPVFQVIDNTGAPASGGTFDLYLRFNQGASVQVVTAGVPQGGRSLTNLNTTLNIPGGWELGWLKTEAWKDGPFTLSLKNHSNIAVEDQAWIGTIIPRRGGLQ